MRILISNLHHIQLGQSFADINQQSQNNRYRTTKNLHYGNAIIMRKSFGPKLLSTLFRDIYGTILKIGKLGECCRASNIWRMLFAHTGVGECYRANAIRPYEGGLEGANAIRPYGRVLLIGFTIYLLTLLGVR